MKEKLQKGTIFIANGFGSGEAIHWWDIVGDHGGEAQGVLRELWGCGSDSGYEGQGHWQA